MGKRNNIIYNITRINVVMESLSLISYLEIYFFEYLYILTRKRLESL